MAVPMAALIVVQHQEGSGNQWCLLDIPGAICFCHCILFAS